MSGTSNYIVGVRINGNASGLSKAAQEALRAQRLLAGGSIREYQRMSEARAQLGVRSEREVQREIAQTTAAYNRLARSGTLSWQEQRIAARGMREEVTRLTNEMGRLTARQKLAMGARVVGALGTATIGAAAVMKPKLDRAISFQDRLRDVANVASDVGAGRPERQKEYEAAQQAVTGAVRYGGGNRDDALDAYNQMVSKGSTFVGDLPRQLLPEIMKAATASASAATDMASIAAAGIQNFGMKPSAADAKEWFNIAAIGGKLGGFEVRQQAAYLPEQMAQAGNIGMRGKTDFANLVMLNQAAEKTAGTPEKAATNVKQFLTDVGSNYFRRKAEKVTGVNFPKLATENRLKGIGMIDSAMQLVDQQVQKHPAYQQLKGRLATTSDPEQRDKITSAMKIIEGSVSSQFFRNQESALVVAAYRLHREFMKTGQKQALSGADEIGTAFDFKSQGAAYQTNRLAIEQAAAMQSSMDKLTPAVGGVSEKLATLMQQYPGYTTAIIAAGGALGFLATAAGAAALMGARLPGAGPLMPPSAPTTPTTPGAAVPPPAAAVASRASRVGSLLGKLGPVAAVASMGWELFHTSDEEIQILKAAERKRNDAQTQASAPATTTAPLPANFRRAAFDDPRLLTRSDGGVQRQTKEPPVIAPLPGASQAAAPLAASTPVIRLMPPPEGATTARAGAPAPPTSSQDIQLFTVWPRPDAMPQRMLGAPRPTPDRSPQSLGDRLLAAKGVPALPQELKGEIMVRVSGAPGLGVQVETRSATAGVSLRADVGTGMNATGH